MARSLVFVTLTLLFSALIILAFEGALRLAGLGSPPELHVSRLEYQQVQLPILAPDRRPGGTAILRPRDPRLPYQAILGDKPENALRIFTLGGSATMGLGFSPNVTFARYLERMLRATPASASWHPARGIEMMNLGIVALSSSQVREIVRDVCANFDPDLIIVYSGNNEFLEIHAEKYSARHASFVDAARAHVSRTNLYRLLSSVVPRADAPRELHHRDLAASNVRMTQAEIIQDIELSSDEIEAVVDLYEENLDHIARTAVEHGVPLVMMSVASNWEWRGRQDLPEDYLAELVDEVALEGDALRARALEILDERILDEARPDRFALLFRRATLRMEMGDFEGARADYRASMNASPHLRRALDSMGERVRRVAERHDVAFVDTVEALSRESAHGIVGFESFYDYVHFTPRGAAVVAAALYRQLQSMGIVPADTSFRPEALTRTESARVEGMRQDDFDVNTWLGIGFDPGNLSDRDLWKYERMADGLDTLLEQEPDNRAALVYRGNVRSHELDGAAAAAADYRAALELEPNDLVVRANLEQLRRGRSIEPPGDPAIVPR